jgi:hypothetical protein
MNTNEKNSFVTTQIVPVPANSLVSSHRYLDVLTTRSSQGVRSALTSSPTTKNPSTYLHGEPHSLSRPETSNKSSHRQLLIEPVLLPNLQHVNVDSLQDLEENCLFYPDGHKNKNIRREIESSVVKHHILENSKMKTGKTKDRFRVVRKDAYANAKGPPLFYGKEKDPEVADLLKQIRSKERKIVNTVQVHI